MVTITDQLMTQAGRGPLTVVPDDFLKRRTDRAKKRIPQLARRVQNNEQWQFSLTRFTCALLTMALTKGLLNRFTHSIDGTLGRPKGIQRTLATLKRCGHPSDRLADDKDGVGEAGTGAVFTVKNPSRFVRNSARSNRLSIREEEDARIERDGASKHKTSPAYRAASERRRRVPSLA